MAKQFGLKDAYPIMFTTPESGELEYLISSDSKCYFWNLLADQIWEITAPRKLKDVLQQMVTKGEASVKTKRVYELEEFDTLD